jgi:chemotaxis phosphatase CheX-like protein
VHERARQYDLERAAITNQIQDLAATACIELLQAYGVEAGAAPDGWSASNEFMLAGVMGFVSERLVGSCLLAGARDVLMATAPADARPRDWVGELANQLVGRLKSKLMGLGVTITMNTPVVLSGISLSPLPRTDVAPAVHQTPLGRLLVWVEVEVDPEFSWGEPQEVPATEGELVVF